MQIELKDMRTQGYMHICMHICMYVRIHSYEYMQISIICICISMKWKILSVKQQSVLLE